MQGLDNIGVSVPVIMLQFSFGDRYPLPDCITRLPEETKSESVARKKVADGELVIEPIFDVDVAHFLAEAANSGYELTGAAYQHRVDQRKIGRFFHMVRFYFVRRELAKPTDEFLESWVSVSDAIHTLCTEAMWRVRVFLNPLTTEHGAENTSESGVSINMEGRKDLLDEEGQPVREWRKDERKRHMGDSPVPICPKHRLEFSRGTIQVLPLAPVPVV